MTSVEIITVTCFSHAFDFEVSVRIIDDFSDLNSVVIMEHPCSGTQLLFLAFVTCMMSHRMTFPMGCSLSHSKGT